MKQCLQAGTKQHRIKFESPVFYATDKTNFSKDFWLQVGQETSSCTNSGKKSAKVTKKQGQFCSLFFFTEEIVVQAG